jgi:hypothetical protein
MKLEYSATGKFVPEAQRLIEDLEADAVMILVFGSNSKGSGACCEMRVDDPVHLGRIMVTELRRLADSIQDDLNHGALAGKEANDQNGHEQAELKHSERHLRPGQPKPGDHL